MVQTLHACLFLADDATAAHAAAALDVLVLHGHGDAACFAAEARHGAVGGEHIGDKELVCASHHWHILGHVHPAHVVLPVGLTEHPIHVGAEGVELEAQLQVGDAVVLGHPVAVHPGFLFRDRHRVEGDLELAFHLDRDRVRGARSDDGHRPGGRWLPFGAFLSRDLHSLAVECDHEAVDRVVPCGSVLSSDVEAVVVQEEGDGLDPGEVPGHGRVSLSDEVGVDVEAGVGEQAEVLVLPAVEVEGDAVAADEARVTAHRAGSITNCNRRTTN